MSTFLKAQQKFVPLVFLTSCFGGPGLFQQDGDANSSGVYLKLSSTDDGVYSAAIDANSITNQLMQIPDGSSINFPPGSLAVSTNINVESGASMASSSLAASLGTTSLTSASTALVITPTVYQDPSAPFSLELPISSTSLRLADDADPYDKLIVIYKTNSLIKGAQEGVILRADIEITADKKARFKSQYFGAFQLAYSATKISNAIEQPASSPILTKREEKKLPEVTWTISFLKTDPSIQSSGYVEFQSTGLTAPLLCYSIGDKDQKFPFDISRKTESSTKTWFYSSDFPSDEDNSLVYYVQIECTDANGRLARSNWSVLFNPTTDPRSNNTETANLFKLNSFPTNTATNGLNPSSSAMFNFSHDVNTTTLYGVSFFNALSGKLFITSFNNGGASDFKNIGFTGVAGTWPLYSLMNVNVDASTVRNLSGKLLDSSKSFSFHTADGLWAASTISGLNTSNPDNSVFKFNDNGRGVLAVRETSGVHYAYYNGFSWGNVEYAAESDTENLSAFIANDGRAYVGYMGSSGIQLKVYDPGVLSWSSNSFTSVGTLATTSFVDGFLFGSRTAGTVFAIYSNTTQVRLCELNPSNYNCAAVQTITASSVNSVRARVNNQGDIAISYLAIGPTLKFVLKPAGNGTIFSHTDITSSIPSTPFAYDLQIWDRPLPTDRYIKVMLAHAPTTLTSPTAVQISFDNQTTTYLADNTFSVISSAPSSTPDFLKVVINRNGQGVISASDLSNNYIASFYDFSSIKSRSSFSKGAAYAVSQIALADSGQFMIALPDTAASMNFMYCNSIGSTLSTFDCETPISIPTGSYTNIVPMGVVVDQSNNFVAVYSDTSNTNRLTVYRKRYDQSLVHVTPSNIGAPLSMSCIPKTDITREGVVASFCAFSANHSLIMLK